MKVIKCIPEVHAGNDKYYWTHIFPNIYKKRTQTIVPQASICIDGDVHTEGAQKYRCHRCSSIIQKFVPRMFGSVDTGVELVYACSECGEIICRIYSCNERNHNL